MDEDQEIERRVQEEIDRRLQEELDREIEQRLQQEVPRQIEREMPQVRNDLSAYAQQQQPMQPVQAPEWQLGAQPMPQQPPMMQQGPPQMQPDAPQPMQMQAPAPAPYWTPVDNLDLSRVMNGIGQVTADLDQGDLSPNTGAGVLAELHQKRQMMEARKNATQQQAMQQQKAMMLDQAATGQGIVMANSKADSESFPARIAEVPIPETGGVARFFQQRPGEWAQFQPDPPAAEEEMQMAPEEDGESAPESAAPPSGGLVTESPGVVTAGMPDSLWGDHDSEVSAAPRSPQQRVRDAIERQRLSGNFIPETITEGGSVDRSFKPTLGLTAKSRREIARRSSPGKTVVNPAYVEALKERLWNEQNPGVQERDTVDLPSESRGRMPHLTYNGKKSEENPNGVYMGEPFGNYGQTAAQKAVADAYKAGRTPPYEIQQQSLRDLRQQQQHADLIERREIGKLTEKKPSMIEHEYDKLQKEIETAKAKQAADPQGLTYKVPDHLMIRDEDELIEMARDRAKRKFRAMYGRDWDTGQKIEAKKQKGGAKPEAQPAEKPEEGASKPSMDDQMKAFTEAMRGAFFPRR